ncbi:MAG: AMP-binding protein [Bacteroidaceae bacterium]|nr:AMP-binding protein [Bacteroidaceae bacterium]
MIEKRFIQIYQDGIRENWELPALTDYSNKHTLTYKDLAVEIAKLHIFLKECGIKHGDKVALVGKNTPQWCTVFIGVITYGAILVPILQEFNPHDMHHILNHSDSKLCFSSNQIWEHLELERLPNIRAAISIDNFKILAQQEDEKADKILASVESIFAQKYPNGFTREDVVYADNGNEELALINYTSGTTGFSKGVMLTGNNLAGNVLFGLRSHLHYKGSRALSFLPLAHAYGCAFDFLTPLAAGSHITLLGRTPSPKILLKALSEVKPNLIICVPLILEKIYRKQIQPLISKGAMRFALNIPLLNDQIYAKIRKQLIDAFGGEFEEVIIGGAPLNGEVEAFLKKIKFPFTVGYGMTECAPLISYTPYREFQSGSSGRTLFGYVETKIEKSCADSATVGEICVRGEHVMQGYYKNEEATNAVIDKDGWLHTGDLGTIGPDGTIFIKGRCKTMLLGANGQNIYPEEIEAKLNNLPYVMESLIVERDGRLTALVFPDFETMDAEGISSDELPNIMEENRKELNKIVAPYEQIARIQLHANEFEKTPKRSIKRYLYTN